MSSKVADLTAEELNALIESAIDRKLSEWLGDPDEGLELTTELQERVARQRRQFAAGERGLTLEEVRQRISND
jgi:uncharacterized protein YheU (UPF0270 family)